MMADSDKVEGSLNEITRKDAHVSPNSSTTGLSLHSLSKFE